MKISASIITFNEEKNIADAIKSVQWADEIVVVDSESTDETVKLAKSLGAKVYVQKWLGFGKQKQLATEKCSNQWIFSLDADERVSSDLADEIKKLKTLDSNDLADAYEFSRLTFYMNRPIHHSGWYPDWKTRLFDREKGSWKEMRVHETIAMNANTKTVRISKDILHYSVEDSAHHHRMIGERYAPLSAEEMYTNGRKTSPAKIMTVGFTTFLKTFVLKGGFLDGFPGFCIARFAAHHGTLYLTHI